MEPIYILSLLLLFSADRGQILKIFQRCTDGRMGNRRNSIEYLSTHLLFTGKTAMLEKCGVRGSPESISLPEECLESHQDSPQNVDSVQVSPKSHQTNIFQASIKLLLER